MSPESYARSREVSTASDAGMGVEPPHPQLGRRRKAGPNPLLPALLRPSRRRGGPVPAGAPGSGHRRLGRARPPAPPATTPTGTGCQRQPAPPATRTPQQVAQLLHASGGVGDQRRPAGPAPRQRRHHDAQASRCSGLTVDLADGPACRADSEARPRQTGQHPLPQPRAPVQLAGLRPPMLGRGPVRRTPGYPAAPPCRRRSHDTTDGHRPTPSAMSLLDRPAARPREISSRSTNVNTLRCHTLDAALDTNAEHHTMINCFDPLRAGRSVADVIRLSHRGR
jgi:hypothetical protein